jgi:hypothetical protein
MSTALCVTSPVGCGCPRRASPLATHTTPELLLRLEATQHERGVGSRESPVEDPIRALVVFGRAAEKAEP